MRRGPWGPARPVAAARGAACSDAGAENQPQPPKTGGTLRVVVSAKPAHLDPQRIATATEANVSRLTTRTLTTFRSEPGEAASEIVGDLATDTGRPSEGNRVWDFQLKDDIRWEDGSPITCADVKYGVERSFSSLLSASPSRMPRRTWPTPTTTRARSSAATTTARAWSPSSASTTATSGSRCPSRSATSATPPPCRCSRRSSPSRTPRANTTSKPFSNGPYKLQENTDQQIVYVRNQYWDRKTDQVRKAYPDKIVFEVNGDLPTVTSNLIQSEGDWARHDRAGQERRAELRAAGRQRPRPVSAGRPGQLRRHPVPVASTPSGCPSWTAGRP